MNISIITIFPRFFDSFLKESLIAKAIKNKKLQIEIINLRDFAGDKHRTVDDTPYGGGPGMVMKVDVWFRALESIVGKQELARRYNSQHKNTATLKHKKQTRIILLDPAGKQFTQKSAQKYADTVDNLVLCCGRYEGFDHRITQLVDERVSVGPYVLNGGEVAAQVVTEAVFRLLPGVLGNSESLQEETYSEFQNSKFKNQHYIEYPQYTRPKAFHPNKKGASWNVPKVLLSGDHKKIRAWRDKKT